MNKWARRATVAAFAALYVLGIWGKWSWYPLRWSEAYFSRAKRWRRSRSTGAVSRGHRRKRTLPYDTDKVREYYAIRLRCSESSRPIRKNSTSPGM